MVATVIYASAARGGSNKLSHFRFSRGNENYVAEIKDGKLYLESNDAPWEKATWQQLRAFKRSDLRKTARTLAADDEVDKALDLEGENGQVNLDGLTALILYYSLSFSEARNQAEALAPREDVDIAMDEESPKSALIALMAAKAQNEDVGKVVANFLRSVNETISVSGSEVEATKNSVRSAKSAPSPTAAYTSNPTMGAMAGYASPMILSQGNTFDSMMEENLRPVTALSPFPENFSPYAAFMKDDFKTFVPDLDSVRAFDPDGYYGDFLPNGSLKTPGTPPGIGVVVYESKYIKRGVFVGQVAQGGIMWEGVVYSNGRGIFSIQPKDTGPQWTHLEPTLEAKYPFVKEFSWVQDDLPTGEGDSETNTTVMMRGFPCNLTRTGLLDQIFEFGFKKSFDFLYLPIDNTKAANKGYAFINLVNREELARFYRTFTGYRQWKNADGSTFKSKKVTWMSWAEMQGQEASINRYRNSPVMLDAEEHKPVVFKDGVQDVFPGPTKRIRENKKKDKA